MREFFRACELEPEMLEQAALTAAFLSAKERCVCPFPCTSSKVRGMRRSCRWKLSNCWVSFHPIK